MNLFAYRPDIDGLRAVAILLVVLFHVFPHSLGGGFIGVDVFFVISGYLITSIILDALDAGKFSISAFYFRRVRRLFPSLLIVLACCLVAGYILLIPSELYKLSKHLLGGLTFVANFTLWSDAGYFNAFPEKNPALHLWSLGVEEQFYLVWPVLLILVTRLARHLLIPVIVVCLLMSFVLNVVLVRNMPDMTFYFPITRFWEIAIGALLVTAERTYQWLKLPGLYGDVASISGLLFILVGALVLDSNTWYPGWWGLLPAMGATLVIQAGPDGLLNRDFLASRGMVWLGLISYPLYLWHWPLFAFFNITGQSWPYGTEKIVIVGLSVLLAWASYRFVELPVKQLQIPSVVRYSLATAIAMVLVSLATFLNDGWPSRFNMAGDYPDDIVLLGKPGFGGYIAEGWREGTCFLEPGQDAGDFTEDCLERGNSDQLLFLWGDSHAAALSPGLAALAQTQGLGFAQYTASACPPVLHWNGRINPLCESINDQILDSIRTRQPDVLVLEAAWYWTEYDWQALDDTLAELTTLGIPKIVLLGAAPSWTDTVPATIYSYYGVYQEIPPTFTAYQLDTQAMSNFDFRLERIASDHGVAFWSLKDVFCNADGCRLYLDNVLEVTSLDSGHLSGNAAVYAAQALATTLTSE